MKLSDLEVVVQIRRRDTDEVLFQRKDVWYPEDSEWGELHHAFAGEIEGDDRTQLVRRGLIRACDVGADEARNQLELTWGLE